MWDWDQPILVALAAFDEERTLKNIHILETEIEKLRPPKTREDQKRHDCIIPHTKKLILVRVITGDLDQFERFITGQFLGDSFDYTRFVDLLQWVLGE